MRDRMAAVVPIVKEHMVKAQRDQSAAYNRAAQPREFKPGDRVLVLVPTVECKFLATWQGPFEVIKKVGEVNYKVHQPGKRKSEQIYHINLLKKWHDRIVQLSSPQRVKRTCPGQSAVWPGPLPSPTAASEGASGW